MQPSIHRTHDVFTPTTPARLAFVEREAVNERLVSALRTPGKQVVVYGHSGCGKTTLLVNKLHQLYEREVTTRCVTGMTFAQIVADGFDQLGSHYTDSSTQELSKNGTLGITYSGVKAQLAENRSTASTTKLVLPPQLTPQTLARLLGAAKCCWVLEDFHKIADQEKQALAQAMKVFMDMADEYSMVRVVAIGAVNTARQVIEYDAEMRNRVSELHVPLMTEDELSRLIKAGEELLNIRFDEAVRDGIVHYSNGLPGVAHQLALNLCLASDVEETLSETMVIGKDALQPALEQYMEEASDTLKAVFDSALRIRRVGKYDNARLVLAALLEVSDEGGTHHEILERVRNTEPDYPAGNLSHFLARLEEPERGSILRFDSKSGRYAFADPLYRAFAKVLLGKGPKFAPIWIGAEVHVSTLLADHFSELKLSVVKALSANFHDIAELTEPRVAGEVMTTELRGEDSVETNED